MQNELSNNLWDYIGEEHIPYLDIYFKTFAPRLLQFLLQSTFSNESLYIGTFSERSKGKLREGAAITYDEFNTNKQLNLKAYSKINYALVLILRDYEQEIITYKYKLSKEEIKDLPEGLQTLMQEVIESGEGKLASINTLNK